jgi:hypothetical protein
MDRSPVIEPQKWGPMETGRFITIISLCDKVMGILGPAPSSYDTTLKYVGKRKLSDRDDKDEEASHAASGHGKQILGSEKAARHQRNVLNQKKHEA